MSFSIRNISINSLLMTGLLVAGGAQAVLSSGTTGIPDGGLSSGGRPATTPTTTTTTTTTNPVTTFDAANPAFLAAQTSSAGVCQGSSGGHGSGSSTTLASGSQGGEGGDEDMWLKQENCKKMFGGSGGGSSSSSSSGGSSSGGSSSGGSSGGGGGGGGGKNSCWHVTAVSVGGGLVGGGGYDGRSGVLEPYLKDEAKKALKHIEEGCNLTTQTQTAGTQTDAVSFVNNQAKAAGEAEGAMNILGRIAEIEMPLVMPLMEAFPKPLAPMAKGLDVAICKKSKKKCEKECEDLGSKLEKQSKECVDNLNKIIAWYKKKKQESDEKKKIWCAAARSAVQMVKSESIGAINMGTCDNKDLVFAKSDMPPAVIAPQPPASEIVADWNDKDKFNGESEGKSLFAPTSGSSAKVTSGAANSIKSAAASYESAPVNIDPDRYAGAKVDSSSYTPVNSDGSFGTNEEKAALPADFSTNADVEGAVSFNGSFQQGDNKFSGSLAGYGIQNEQVAQELGMGGPNLGSGGSAVSATGVGVKANGERLYILNTLTLAREKLITKEMPNKQKKVELKMEPLSMFERGSRGYYGSDGRRALFLAQQEKKRNKALDTSVATAPSQKPAAPAKNDPSIKPATYRH